MIANKRVDLTVKTPVDPVNVLRTAGQAERWAQEIMKELHFFKTLENELANSFDFIEPDPENQKCYGAKYASLLYSVCIEFESLCKTLIRIKEPEANVGNIGLIKGHMLRLFPNIGENEVENMRIGKSFQPLEFWGEGRLSWWDAYVDIKHDRISNYPKATMHNIFDAMSALLVIIIYIGKFRDDCSHLTCGKIFWMKSMGTHAICSGEKLPDE